MKKLIILIVVFMASSVFAAPFLVCDPQVGVTEYKLTGPMWVPATIVAQSDGSIKMDVASATIGSNSLTVAACKTDPIWGVMCSDAVPFTFIRPSVAVPPVNIRLEK